MPPLQIVDAMGDYITLNTGEKLIDGIASWWCKVLGHKHPVLTQALKDQADRFEHVMLGGVVYDEVERLSKRLCDLTRMDKVFYACDGSSAVEIALKMALHAQRLQGRASKVMALENDYHGETCGALSVTDIAYFQKTYAPYLFKVDFLKSIPYVSGPHDPLWTDCSSVWPLIEAQLSAIAPTIIIVESIVQGAIGMQVYSADFLSRLSAWALKNKAYLIVDEIMTGFGRTGKWFAYQHANIEPDFICVGKGLTAGYLPMSAVMTRQDIFLHFYSDDKASTFFHSHTFSGNALSVAVAHACLDTLIENDYVNKAAENSVWIFSLMHQLAEETHALRAVRGVGAMVAADLIRQSGADFYPRILKEGAFLRPIGQAIYWFLPLNTERAIWTALRDMTARALRGV